MMVPRSAQMISAEVSTSPRPMAASRRRTPNSAARKARAQQSPYQWICSGPSDSAMGSKCQWTRGSATDASHADAHAHRRHVADGPDLDRAVLRPRQLAGHAHGLLHRVGLDEVEAG